MATKLKLERVKRDLPLRELAVLTGMSVTKLNAIERGMQAKISEKLAIARGLGLRVDELWQPEKSNE